MRAATSTAGTAAVGAVAPVDPWRLVAPWYRWERRDGAEPERVEGAGRPALHKFASTAFVADFLADPQRSVVFDDVVDRHQTITPVVDVPLPGDTLKRRRFLATTSASPGDTRKLFLVPHGRHYLVAAGLHCDAPGFPRVDPASVAEAGFVLRRHRVVVPPGATKDGAVLLHELAQARAVAQAELGFDTARSRARRLHPFGSAARERVVDPSAASVAAHREVVLARRKLAVWAGSAGVEHRTEGWVPTGRGQLRRLGAHRRHPRRADRALVPAAAAGPGAHRSRPRRPRRHHLLGAGPDGERRGDRRGRGPVHRGSRLRAAGLRPPPSRRLPR